jgi:microbial collagenase
MNMPFPRLTTHCAVWLLLASTSSVMADPHHGVEQRSLKQAQAPRVRQALPPTPEQAKFNLSATRKARTDLGLKTTGKNTLASLATPDCQDMNKLAGYSGSALADYLVNLPDYECHYGLFSLSATQAATIYSAANFSAVANRFVQEAANYHADNIKLVNLLIYLRAGYYLASGNTIPAPAASLLTTLRPAISQLLNGTQLFAENPAGPSTAGETLKLITNMNDELNYLASVKTLITRYTNSSSNPNAARALLGNSAAGGFTGALTVVFYAHYRSGAANVLYNDASMATLLNNFVVQNKATLLGSNAAYQLHDALNEAYRFMQYPALLPTIKPMVQGVLANSSMTGSDNALWLAAASSVKYYDNPHCADYGTCNFETRLADVVLKTSYTCSPTIRIRAQDMTADQLKQSCDTLASEEGYFHTMLQSKNKPVANDQNTALEVVVFDDYSNYDKYASVIYGISTNNGGMYLEGDPATPGNQARFIAHEASWLRPVFSVWNLQHEYIHYLDGRFDMQGDFSASTAKPTVWWIEGLAEYLSLKNGNQTAIDVGKTGTYPLSTIFGNTYSMSDYVPRAYRWGYLATRFMVEKHRADVDQAVSYFRAGNYDAYQTYMTNIGKKYDSEFATWAQTASTAGEPPLPTTSEPTLPRCGSSNSQLGKNCSIGNLASSSQTYAYILLPTGAKNLRLYTTGGTGDVDLYVAKGYYPGTGSYDFASTNSGNSESVRIASPTSGQWYYITLRAKQAFSGVSLNASYQ